jgi:Ca2+-binding EF-hand superfamily protein
MDVGKLFSGFVELLGQQLDRSVGEVFGGASFDATRPDSQAALDPKPNADLVRERAGYRNNFREMLPSLSGYAVAPDIERRCLFAVSLHTVQTDLEEFRPAFCYADVDCDGVISRNDLHTALQSVGGLRSLDSYALFRAADVDRSGSLSFKEFAAACLHSRLAPLDIWLAEQAFLSLDHDRDGLLSAADVQPVFGGLPAGLPAQRPFGLEEWCACLVRLPMLLPTPRDFQCCVGGDEVTIFLRACCARKISSCGRSTRNSWPADSQDWVMQSNDNSLSGTPAAQNHAKKSDTLNEIISGSVFSSPAYTPNSKR